MIRRYPALKLEHDELMTQSITPTYSGMPGGSKAARLTENTAIQVMQKNSMREYYAVREAVEQTRALSDGEERIKLIELVFWKSTHSLVGASMECNVCERTGREWHRQFIRLVASKYGVLE